MSQDALFKSFSTSFLAEIPSADRIEEGHDGMDRVLSECWDAAQIRKAGEKIIRVRPVPDKNTKRGHEKTSILVATEDRSFVIDSIAAELTRNNLVIQSLLHTVLTVNRDKAGKLQSVGVHDRANTAPDVQNESWVYIEIQGILPESHARVLEKDLDNVIDDVFLATRDWMPMLVQLDNAIADIGAMPADIDGGMRDEYKAFLQYLHDNNFTLLGYREYRFDIKKDDVASRIVDGTSLGLLSDERRPVFVNQNLLALPQHLQKLRLEGPVVNVYKVNRRSTVHRRVPLDAITVKLYDKKGNITGEKMFIGLFTSVTYSRSVADVPMLRYKVRKVIDDANFAKTSHDYRALAHILEKYPRDELFQMPVDQIKEYALSILRLQERQRVALYTRVDPFRRYISCLVYVPRDRYETNLRLTLQRILENELHGICDSFYTTLDDSPLARVLFIIRTDQRAERVHDFAALEEQLVHASRTWAERLRSALMEDKDSERRAIELAVSYDNAFPTAYQENFSAVQAVADIDKIESAITLGRIAMDLYEDSGDLRLKLYNPGGPAALSDILPILENMDLRVVNENPFSIRPREGAQTVFIHDFLLAQRGANVLPNLHIVKPLFEEALSQVWYGSSENDTLNNLILKAGLSARDIVILRAYARYMFQGRYPYSPAYISLALTDHPNIAAALVSLFHARMDPRQDAKSARHEADAAQRIEDGLAQVVSLDQDRILRAIRLLIEVTLRTNFYQRDENGMPKDRFSVKLDSQRIPDLPEPRPMVEIFVYSPRMEGIHLRGGRIARGGIRWSDRPEDYRTEILGLMQAQMVKNAVIVPEGAKGGFILKKPPTEGGREAFLKEGIACYQTLVRGMLDITDNMNGNDIIPPQNVVRHDGDDPYLVVAADKGTATFSDVANAISGEYGFWLGDAFASGGSQGYDHKEIGITARGAWESIKRHFRELGQDIQSEPFDVTGVGDMGGDVFGNGMLLSPVIRLVAAFNHQHIFIDPTPDTKKPFAERKRLFDAVKGWGDYDTRLLSKGGRIYSRSEKKLELTPEIRARLDITEETCAPDTLIRAILKARTDLLYFGGIGTYIKGVNQSHADAGDKTNDNLRVDSNDIRARVLGEGANLGVTRRARVEMGLNGVKLNADFIDNSGGVDCSDHEVNIKILLNDLTGGDKPGLGMAERNKLLESMTDEVAALVLRDNYQQSQAISMAELDAAEHLPTHARLITYLERANGFKRSVEGLPSPAEIEERLTRRVGLTRPELGILISHAKIMVYNALLQSNLPDDPLAENWLLGYFPQVLQQKYADAIRNHRLKREIIANQMTASIVNRLGPAFMVNITDKTGASIGDIARMCFVVRESYDLRKLWHAVEALDAKIPARAQQEAMRVVVILVDYAVQWLLKQGEEVRDMALPDLIAKFGKGVASLRKNLENILPRVRFERVEQHVRENTDQGMPDDIAHTLSELSPMRSAGDIISIAARLGEDPANAARAFFYVGEELQFDWLRFQSRLLSGSSRWQAEAIEGVVNQLYATQASISQQVLKTGDKSIDAIDRLHAWEEKHKDHLQQFDAMLTEMRRGPQLDLAMLTLAEQRLRALAG